MSEFILFIILAFVLQAVIGKRMEPYVKIAFILMCWYWGMKLFTHMTNLLRIG